MEGHHFHRTARASLMSLGQLIMRVRGTLTPKKVRFVHLVAMLRRRKQENSWENEENSVFRTLLWQKWFYQAKSKNFRQKNGCFRRLNIPPWFDKLEFSFFPFIKNISSCLLYPALPVCKPEAVSWGIAIRAKVEQKGRVIFLFGKK